MDYDSIYKIIENNKNVPFVKKIIEKKEVSLSSASYEGKWIVYSGALDQAIKKNSYIEFEGKDEAAAFIANYKLYWGEKQPEQMNQKEYEGWRTSPAGRAYTVSIDDGTKYRITVEPK